MKNQKKPNVPRKKRRFLHQCIAAALLIAGVLATERLWPPSSLVVDRILETSSDISVLKEKVTNFFYR